MFRKINLYFFGEEDIPLSDSLIFYGQYAIMLLMLALIVVVNLTM
jgi:hypothetical protein